LRDWWDSDWSLLLPLIGHPKLASSSAFRPSKIY
jgi:hypothetical protein